MKIHLKRVLSLLLVVVLVFGMFPKAMAASIDGTGETEPTYPEDLLADLPDPVEGYDSNDPDNPYPYGIPVTDLVPEDILEQVQLYSNGVAAIADDTQGSIPDEMWDNSILRALEYIGYDVQRQKDRGQLYEYRYIASRLKQNDPAVLSNVGYWNSGSCPNGDETVADATTVSGKAPNIPYFEDYGLFCASFVSYYLCNFLPNIEGVNTDLIYETAKKYGKDDRYDDVYYLTSVTTWKKTLDDLANQSGSGVTKYTDEDTAYENLVPGDVIVFAKSSGALAHIGIYAGEYDLYSYGNSLGIYHFLIHVGNSRGPEINIVEWMAESSGDKASTPVAWYHLDIHDIQETGFIEINKADPEGAPLAGAYFVATDNATQQQYIIGPTDSTGYAISPELPLGTYTVVESVFPEDYQASGQSSWTVTLSEDTPNMTISIHAVNELTKGTAKIVKATTNGGSVSGWPFKVMDADGNEIGSYVTDSTGVITLDLLPGTYTVTETGGTAKYWVNDPTPTKTVTVKANETATVTFTNQYRGQAQIVKVSTNSGTVEGWHFTVKDSSGTVVGSYLTDSTGIITLDLEPGTYTVTEAEILSDYWTNDPSPTKTVTVTAGQTATVTFTNSWFGRAQIIKTASNGGSVAGWPFTVKDSNGTEIGSYVTDSTGIITINLDPGTYTVIETDGAYEYWHNDPNPTKTITVKAGQTATVTFENQWVGKAQIIKTLSNPEAGTGAGWTFSIHRLEGDTAQYVTTVTTGEDGTIIYDLDPGDYLITEELAEDSMWECTSGISQTVTVTAGQTAHVAFTNTLRSGIIQIQKEDTQSQHLAGVEFLLEWSEDGENWKPVSFTDAAVPQIGGCTTAGMTDGKLKTDANGAVVFEGLHPMLQYRLTETATLDGYQLLSGPAYEGELPLEKDFTISLTVVNAEVFTLPRTGSRSLALLPAALGLCLITCTGALLLLHKKEGF